MTPRFCPFYDPLLGEDGEKLAPRNFMQALIKIFIIVLVREGLNSSPST